MNASAARLQLFDTTIEMVQFGQFIRCLKLYEGERSEPKKNLTYNTLVHLFVVFKFDIQHLKWCNVVIVFVVKNGMRASIAGPRKCLNTTLEMLQRGSFICC
jgi:hypothetical protein